MRAFRFEPRAENHFSEAIAREVLRVVGVRVTALGFRSFVACMILEHDPHAWTDVAAVLGHTSLLTAQKHYAWVNRLAAAERLSAGLRRQRKQLERVRHRPCPAVRAARGRRDGAPFPAARELAGGGPSGVGAGALPDERPDRGGRRGAALRQATVAGYIYA